MRGLNKQVEGAGSQAKPSQDDKIIDVYYCPTLSELIEARGHFVAIWESHLDRQWHASRGETGYEDTYIDNDGNDVFNG